VEVRGQRLGIRDWKSYRYQRLEVGYQRLKVIGYRLDIKVRDWWVEVRCQRFEVEG
jgi:hypothetical protein